MTWLTQGNSGTDPAQHFLGTTDGKPLNIKASDIIIKSPQYNSTIRVHTYYVEFDATVKVVGQNNLYVDSPNVQGGRFTITGTGNVGIGNPKPTRKLDVAGEVQAADFLIPSDERLKMNVSQLSGSLDSLDAVHGVTFDWSETAERTGHANGRKQIGVIAQELAAVHPELVFAAEGENGYLAVDYSKLTAVLLEAIKELRTESESKIRALGEELVSLRQELSRLAGSAGSEQQLAYT